MATTWLGPKGRAEALASMKDEELDVLVVGGGIVGAGIALDAVSRGLSTGLVEARDFASGTSSRSSKLIHGGLRYLEQFDFELVREALHERGLLLTTIAPHLVRPVPFLFPFARQWERAYIGAGVTLYDVLAMSSRNNRGLPSHRHLSRNGALKVFPALKRSALAGAIQYWDCQVDDARLVTSVLRTAAGLGARIASRVQAVGFLREGEHVVGASVADLETGDELRVRARQVVNAAGVWTDDIQEMVGGRGQIHVSASKGIHLVVPRDRIQASSGMILRTEKSVLFVIPWGRHWIIGTTDTAWDLDKENPAASRADIDYVLDHVNQVLRTPLGRDDVEGVYAGLRPLLTGESEETSKLSREHTVAHPVPGLVLIAGGKYTTYRVMAKDAVDAVAHGLGSSVPQSVTDRLPLVGADGYAALYNQRYRLARDSGLHVSRITHLLRRHGSGVHDLLDLVRERPDLGRPLAAADDYLRAEIVYAAEAEGARHLEDVLSRRTRISFETWDRGIAAAEEAAELLAGPLDWSKEQIQREVEYYRKGIEAERAAQEQDTDQEADAIQHGAPEIVPEARVTRD
ncbi:glycerol-3-phosphate dehydrogenase/oxidase [Nocardiopsis tropica]|jgi:glycerol-3-phosphate dehydrogenase|uniref:Glycerol-3-phosphate dehydrogenase n=1 Tax=Nocardiopsis tropica TaxID=109330 RepID=A0ABU7KMA1_9ACTN|nr:glycerol-3-phosphate dehydrogenase/oxidase [Nocardiopsis umidischolae]MEE2050419.1 glycerol-3-phosphate dehydrogenase/oxidase [Nocardiopsis umidischolae]